MAVRKKKRSFEEGMALLGVLTDRMSSPEQPLEQSMQDYEEGMALVAELAQELDALHKRIEQIDVQTGEITTFEEKENDIQ